MPEYAKFRLTADIEYKLSKDPQDKKLLEQRLSRLVRDAADMGRLSLDDSEATVETWSSDVKETTHEEKLFHVHFYIEVDNGDRDQKEVTMWECVISSLHMKSAEAWAERARPAIHKHIPNPINSEAYGNEPLEYPELICFRVMEWSVYTEKMKNLGLLVDGWINSLPDEDAEEEDDGCPVNDPDCLGNAGDNHDACVAPDEEE